MDDEIMTGSDLRRLVFGWGQWDHADGQGANRALDRVHSAAKALSTTSKGRSAISLLLSDTDRSVQMCAATCCLRWNEDAARRVLEDIRPGDQSLRAVTAKYTLNEWDAGRLSLDY